MALKLNSSGGGSVTVDAPVTASNLTVTLPSSNGTIATTDGTNTTFTSITDSGNLNFTGTGNRITGDFSNATIANRVIFQTSTAGGNTRIAMMPNAASGGTSGPVCYSTNDPANASFLDLRVTDGTETSLRSDKNGTGTYLPMAFYTGGSERMRIDTSGNVGIGTTPSARFQVQDVNGNFGGSAANSALYIGSSLTGNQATTLGLGTGSGSTFDIVLFAAGATPANAAVLNQRNSAPMMFQTANTERMRIDSSGNLLVGTTSAATPSTTGYISTANTFGFKNRIINGAMMIDQRNAGAEVNPIVTGSYYLDRWQVTSTAASKFKMQQNAGSVTPPVGFTNYLGLTSLSAYTVGSAETFSTQQPIEGLNVSDLAWGTANAATVTLSFWVRSSLTGTFGGSIRNSAADRSYPYSYTISSANTWEQKSITIPGDTTGTWLTTNGIGIRVLFSIGAGSTFQSTAGAWVAGNYTAPTGQTSVVGTNGATFYITGVQLEKGTAATSFDFRPYTTELQLCQRYYYKLFPQATTSHLGVGFCNSTTNAPITGTFPVTMRIAPTALEQSGTAGDYAIVSGSSSMLACSAVPAFSVPTNTQVFQTSFTVASGLTVGQGAVGRTGASTGANGYLAWSAEL